MRTSSFIRAIPADIVHRSESGTSPVSKWTLRLQMLKRLRAFQSSELLDYVSFSTDLADRCFCMTARAGSSTPELQPRHYSWMARSRIDARCAEERVAALPF